MIHIRHCTICIGNNIERSESSVTQRHDTTHYNAHITNTIAAACAHLRARRPCSPHPICAVSARFGGRPLLLLAPANNRLPRGPPLLPSTALGTRLRTGSAVLLSPPAHLPNASGGAAQRRPLPAARRPLPRPLPPAPTRHARPRRARVSAAHRRRALGGLTACPRTRRAAASSP